MMTSPSAVVDQAMTSLTSEFTGLKIGKTAVYNFMTSKCNLTFKKAHMYCIQFRGTALTILSEDMNGF